MLVKTNLVSELSISFNCIKKTSLLPHLQYEIEITNEGAHKTGYFKRNKHFPSGTYFVIGFFHSLLCVSKIFVEQDRSFAHIAFSYCHSYVALFYCFNIYFHHKYSKVLSNIYNQFIEIEKRLHNLYGSINEQFCEQNYSKSAKFAKLCMQFFRMNFLAAPIFFSVTTFIFPEAPWTLLPNRIAEWQLSVSDTENTNGVWILNIFVRVIVSFYTYFVARIVTSTLELASTMCLTIAHFAIYSIGFAIET